LLANSTSGPSSSNRHGCDCKEGQTGPANRSDGDAESAGEDKIHFSFRHDSVLRLKLAATNKQKMAECFLSLGRCHPSPLCGDTRPPISVLAFEDAIGGRLDYR
jgi:hypothetical protein